MKYKDYQRNHVILPGREQALEDFLRQNYKGMQHKWKNGFSSNSEDALTWSCFEVLSSLPLDKKITLLNEMFEDAYQGQKTFPFKPGQIRDDEIQIHIGKQYTGAATKESTEVDASIELPGILVFIEAKLYSPMSAASPPDKPHDQIARKLRVGLDNPLQDTREFYFIFLDIAPLEKLIKRGRLVQVLAPSIKGFHDKWKSAWLFDYYKRGRNKSLKPLKQVLAGIDTPPVQSIAENMGWLTWSDLYKSILRAVVTN